MSSSILGADQPQAFACPKCKEMINTSMTECAYCQTPVDAQWAQWAGKAQDTINRAFNDGNNVKLFAQAQAVFYLASFIPLIGFVFGWGAFFLALAAPIMAARWFYKYQLTLQGIDKNDADLRQGRRRTLIGLGIWAVLMVVWFVVNVIATIFWALQAA